jgi:beta-barrel assembly-enhancing protease
MRAMYLLITAVVALSQLSSCVSMRRELGSALISDETEFQLGQQVAAQIDSTQKRLADEGIQRYINQIAAPLVQRALGDRTGIEYSFTVLDDARQINAFAAPGGFLYVYSGLLIAADDEAEVAGVLAHEIGHIVGRHSANQLAAQFGIQLLTSIALGEEPNQGAAIIAQMAAQLGSARFSRDDEREADKYGVKYTIDAGYDPEGLLSFFAKLKKLEGGKRSDVDKLLSSHPATDERIRDIEARIERYGAEGGKKNRERFLRETAALRR